MNTQPLLKDREAYGRVAMILGAMANPVRLEIVELLRLTK